MRLQGQAVLVGAGAAGVLVTALAMALLDVHAGFALHSLTVCFVLPVGGLAGGFAAAGILWPVARKAHARPSRGAYAASVPFAFAWFALIHAFEYGMLDVDGTPLREIASFRDFLDFSMTQQSVEIRFHGARLGSSGKLGEMGYLRALLEIAGFAVGFAAVLLQLARTPWCSDCARYLRRELRQVRHVPTEPVLREAVAQVAEDVAAGRVDDAVARHAEAGTATAPKSHGFRSTVEVTRCGQCGVRCVHHFASRLVKKEWKADESLEFRSYVAAAGAAPAAPAVSPPPGAGGPPPRS